MREPQLENRVGNVITGAKTAEIILLKKVNKIFRDFFREVNISVSVYEPFTFLFEISIFGNSVLK